MVVAMSDSTEHTFTHTHTHTCIYTQPHTHPPCIANLGQHPSQILLEELRFLHDSSLIEHVRVAQSAHCYVLKEWILGGKE